MTDNFNIGMICAELRELTVLCQWLFVAIKMTSGCGTWTGQIRKLNCLKNRRLV